jgi:uncharacterized protein YjbI with pentapeptide repeats
MASSQRDHLQNLISEHNRRLQLLKEQMARQGRETPPSVITEIEDIEGKLKGLAAEFEQFGGTLRQNKQSEYEKQYQIALHWAEDGRKTSLSRFDLSNADLRGVDLSGANLSISILRGADLWMANLQKADLRLADLSRANLQEAELYGANFHEANLSWVKLHRSLLDKRTTIASKWRLVWEIVNQQGVVGWAKQYREKQMKAEMNEDPDWSSKRNHWLRKAPLEWVDLSMADLSVADLSWAYLYGANLSKSILTNTNLKWAMLNGADLSEANLQNALLGGATLRDTKLVGADLSYAKMEYINDDGEDQGLLYKTTLKNADLSSVSLVGAKLEGADLSGVKFTEANLSQTDLRFADLSYADLTGTNLEQANLEKTKYNNQTKWPKGFDPAKAGAIFQE